MAVRHVYGVGLDAGSRATRIVITILEQGRVRLLGSAKAEAHGWQKGRIADQKAVSESIRTTLREAERAAGVSVDATVVGMGGRAVRGANARGVLELGYVREIDQRDVNRVVSRATRVQLLEDRMVLQLFPQDFVVDDHPGHRDPRKMMASRLEINVHLVACSIQEHNALIGAVNQAHLNVEETVFEALAACYAVVLPEARREGIAVIDIGAQSSELVIYYGDAMYLASAIPVCGDHFTRDLAQALHLSFDDAETVKLAFGNAVSSEVAENCYIELPGPEDRPRRDVQRRFVSRILEARAIELFKFVRSEFARVGMDRALIGGVFLTGAGSKLAGLCDAAENVLECQTRFGWTEGVQDWPPELNDPEWCTAAGLAMYSAKLKQQMQFQKDHTSWLGKMLK